MRAILDPNVLISALLSPNGRPARVLRLWQEGAFELVVSRLLLAELARALAYPKLRRHITEDEANELVDWLARAATVVDDPTGSPPIHSSDPGDDYLLALAAAEDAMLVTGDVDLLALSRSAPVRTPAAFATLLDT
ncbi:MAG: putative toxin-antitoxin system toxin component, PIN family [Gaiellaceae bacterium]